MEKQQSTQSTFKGQNASQKGRKWLVATLSVLALIIVCAIVMTTEFTGAKNERNSTPAEIAAQEEFSKKLTAAQKEFEKKVETAAAEATQKSPLIEPTTAE